MIQPITTAPAAMTTRQADHLASQIPPRAQQLPRSGSADGFPLLFALGAVFDSVNDGPSDMYRARYRSTVANLRSPSAARGPDDTPETALKVPCRGILET